MPALNDEGSKNAKHAQTDCVGKAFSCADEEALVEPLVGPCWCFKDRCGSEVVLGGVHWLASCDSLERVSLASSQPSDFDLNQGAVVGDQDVVGVQFGCLIGANDLPVSAAGKQRSTDMWPVERA